MEMPLSYLSVNRTMKYMRLLGLYPIEPESPRISRFCHKIYRYVIFYLMLVYTSQILLKIYNVRNDADKVIANTFVFLTFSGYNCKLIIIASKFKQINQVLDTMKGPVFNQGEVEHRKPLLKAVKRAIAYGSFFNYIAVIVWVIMHLHIIVSHIQGKLIEFAIYLPFDYNLDPQMQGSIVIVLFYVELCGMFRKDREIGLVGFYLAVLYNWIIATAAAFGNSSYDVLIVSLMEQCTTQMSIVRLNIKLIVEKSIDEQIKTRHTFNDIFERRMKSIILHHKEIVYMAARLDDIFGGLLLYHFFIEGWILCMLTYSITNGKQAITELMSLVGFLVTVLTEISLYCYFGNDVTLESQKLLPSLYEMDWLILSVKQRRTLLIFMERCKRPIIPMAGKIISLSNTTFISVLRSAYSCYAFLENSQIDA